MASQTPLKPTKQNNHNSYFSNINSNLLHGILITQHYLQYDQIDCHRLEVQDFYSYVLTKFNELLTIMHFGLAPNSFAQYSYSHLAAQNNI